MEQLSFQELTDRMMGLYRDGRFADALRVVEQNAAGFPDQPARLAFWQMCLLSLCGREDEVISVLREALESGLWWSESQFADPDLDAVRDLPEFRRLVAVSHRMYEAERAHIRHDYAVLQPETQVSDARPLLIAVHGRNGNKDSHLQHWEVARRRGWLVLVVQSTQPLSSASYCWDEAGQGLADLRHYYGEAAQKYAIDPQRVIVAGFSQGAGMGIYAALRGQMGIRGFIGVASFWRDPASLVPTREPAQRALPVRGYFVTGQEDHTFKTVKEMQKILDEHRIPFAEEVHPGLPHEFPPAFDTSFENAVDFIFKEQG